MDCLLNFLISGIVAAIVVLIVQAIVTVVLGLLKNPELIPPKVWQLIYLLIAVILVVDCIRCLGLGGGSAIHGFRFFGRCP